MRLNFDTFDENKEAFLAVVQAIEGCSEVARITRSHGAEAITFTDGTMLTFRARTSPNLRRPNHYYHDGLGCPHECTGDHNHPETK